MLNQVIDDDTNRERGTKISVPSGSSDEGIYEEEEEEENQEHQEEGKKEEEEKEEKEEEEEEEEEDKQDDTHRPIEILRNRDVSRRHSFETDKQQHQQRQQQQDKQQQQQEQQGKERDSDGNSEFSEETSRKFARLSEAYGELCKKAITIVHSPSEASNMFASGSVSGSISGHEDAFQSCDTVHNLPSRYSRNNLLPKCDDGRGDWRRHQSLGLRSALRGLKGSAASAADDSRPLKPNGGNGSRRLISRMVFDTLLSYVRNVGCYLFFVCFVSIVIIHPQPVLMSRPEYEIDVILLLVGSLVLSWQIFNVIKQIFKFRVSVVQEVLIHNLVDPEEFEEIVERKRSTPPYLTLELKVKKLSTVACFLFGCCTCCRRGIDYLLPKRHCTVLQYDGWFDASYVEHRQTSAARLAGEESAAEEGRAARGSVFQGALPPTPHVVIVDKDYRLVDRTTSDSVDREIKVIKTLFSQDLELDESHVTSEINVDVQEGLRFPDVEAFLLLDARTLARGRENSTRFCARHPFFSPKTLLFFSLFGLDSVYYTIFLFKCLRPTQFCVVKYIRRSAAAAMDRLPEETCEPE